jgi:hypothetical protein
MKKPLILTVALILVLLLVFFLPIILLLQNVRDEKINDSALEDKIEEHESLIENDKENTVIIDEAPANENASYFEKTTSIDGQPMYFAYPLEIILENPPELVIYSHGQLRRITENLNEEYMVGLRDYASLFASEGYAFAASNEHGDNWGGTSAMIDIQNAIEHFEKESLQINNKIHLIGFSMGGLSSINFAVNNSEKILSITLLAPTPNMNLNEEDIKKIHNIPIKIYHGDSDVNIPLNNSIRYKELFERHGKDVNLHILEELEHYDLEFWEKENSSKTL